MIAFKLYQHPEPDLIHRFSILEPQVSKFSVSTWTEEREARRSLAAAMAAEDKDGMAEAAARIIGARDYDLDALKTFRLHLGPGIAVDIDASGEYEE